MVLNNVIESMQGAWSHACVHITGGKLIVYGSCFVSSCTFIETSVLWPCQVYCLKQGTNYLNTVGICP